MTNLQKSNMSQLKIDNFCESLIFLDEKHNASSKYLNGKSISTFENPTYDVDKMIEFVNNDIDLLAYNLRYNVTDLVKTLDSVKDELLLSLMDGIIIVKSGWQIINFKYTNNKCGKYLLVDLDSFDIYNKCDYHKEIIIMNHDLNKLMIKCAFAVVSTVFGYVIYKFATNK